MIVLDTSGLLAALLASQDEHKAARRTLESEPGPFVLSPFVLAEVDYFIARGAGTDVEVELLDEVARGAYELAKLSGDDVAAARDVIRAYGDLGIGLADSSIVVLAGKLGTDRVLTLDERHFRALGTPQGRPFTILPADA
ncbi:MAG: PIN domain-containing protein [Gaiellaceae bacterium]